MMEVHARFRKWELSPHNKSITIVVGRDGIRKKTK
jgi:hypothetical protein